LAQGEGTDTIVDFEVGIDLIVLEGLVFEDLTLTSVGDLTRIELGNETLAILEGVDRLSENSFV
jgi:Ca2+-binding RTX toxin-like protein